MTPEERLRKHEHLVRYAPSGMSAKGEAWWYERVAVNTARCSAVEADYPTETADLKGDARRYHQGFHCGVVAALRWMLAKERAVADQCFPDIDVHAAPQRVRRPPVCSISPEEMEKKYEAVVWFARVDLGEDFAHLDKGDAEKFSEIRFQAYCAIELEYPSMIADLSGGDGDWHHGLNSGVLAGLRWMLEDDREIADDLFPFLSCCPPGGATLPDTTR